LPGIQEDIQVNLERDAFTLRYDPARVNLEQMYEAIESLGYSPGLEPGAPLDSQSSEVSSESPLRIALIQAANEDKLVFVDFFAEWCIACKALEELVLAEDAVQAALEEYVFVKIDTDEYADVATEYQVVGMPTLLVLNANGDELYRSVGQVQETDLAAKLSQLAAE
jgi:thiol:disulfide interchange protein